MTGAQAEYVALEVGRGGPGPKKPAAQLCREWNAKLKQAHAAMEFHPGRGATGNYVVRCEGQPTISEVFETLSVAVQRPFAVFSGEGFLRSVNALEQFFLNTKPAVTSASRRPTPGAVINLDPIAGRPPLLPAADPKIHPVEDRNAWTSSEFVEDRIRGVWKNDLLRADGIALDPDRREGTWGAIAKAMERAHEGKWTARALSTLRGLAQKLEDSSSLDSVLPKRSLTTEERRVEGATLDVVSLLRDASIGTPVEQKVQCLLERPEGDSVQTLMQARTIAETIARMVCKARGLEVGGKTFATLCQEIGERGLLGTRGQICLHTLRKYGNFANHEAHSSDLNTVDVHVVLLMLLQLIRAVPAGRR